MTRQVLVLAFLLIASFPICACDSCGSSIIGADGGLLSQYRKSYLSIGWSQSAFTTLPLLGESANDRFNAFDISYQRFLSKRLSVRVYQPFQLNVRTYPESEQSESGFGDTRLGANYTFFMHSGTDDPFEVFLDAGAGLILPTGQYDPNIHDRLLPENFNPGRGSLGYVLQQTNSISYGSLGLLIRNTWTSFSDTKENYSFGSQWVGNFYFLWEQAIDSSFSIVPLVGGQFEKVNADQYANGNSVPGTGGDGFFVSFGGQLKLNNLLCTMQYSLPVSATYSNGEVEANNRMTVQLTYLF